jgi:hypothetical protein
MSLRNPGRSRPGTIIAEVLCRQWHLRLRNHVRVGRTCARDEWQGEPLVA